MTDPIKDVASALAVALSSGFRELAEAVTAGAKAKGDELSGKLASATAKTQKDAKENWAVQKRETDAAFESMRREFEEFAASAIEASEQRLRERVAQGEEVIRNHARESEERLMARIDDTNRTIDERLKRLERERGVPTPNAA